MKWLAGNKNFAYDPVHGGGEMGHRILGMPMMVR